MPDVVMTGYKGVCWSLGNIIFRSAIYNMDRITELHLIEQAEHEQRVMAEALRDTAAALNSSRSFVEVLDRLLDNVGKVVHYDMATLMLLEEHKIARVACSHGYREHGLEVKRLDYSVDEIPNFRNNDGNWSGFSDPGYASE